MCDMDTSEVACIGFGGNQHLEVDNVMGKISIIVDGTASNGNNNAGPFTISVKKRTISGMGGTCDPKGVTSRCDTDLTCQGGTCVTTSAVLECTNAVNLTAMLASGPVSVTGTTLNVESGYYTGSCAYDQNNSYPEKIYRIDVTQPSIIDATTDDMNATDYDTVVYLRQGSCTAMDNSCNDDVDQTNGDYRSHLISPTLAPGTYYLFVDGSSAATYGDFTRITRDFKLTVTLTVTGPAPDGGDM
jgi:hypothetical protein